MEDRPFPTRPHTGTRVVDAVAGRLVFRQETERGTTLWTDPEEEGPGAIYELGPAELIRHGLTDRMREALAQEASDDWQGDAEHEVATGAAPQPEQIRPAIKEGETGDGWRWSVIEGDELLIHLTNKPAVEQRAGDPTATPLALQQATFPLDVLGLIFAGP